MARLLMTCLLLGMAAANVRKNRISSPMSDDEQRALDKARDTWDHLHHGAPHPSFMEIKGEEGLRGTFKSQILTRSRAHAPRLGARVPHAKVDMAKGPGTFFTDLENTEHYPLKFRQACVQLNIPTGLGVLSVDLGIGFIKTWGKTCKGDGKPCYMQVDADLGIALTADLGVVHGSVYINGHIDISSTEVPSCKDVPTDEKGEKKASASAEDPSKDSKCGHWYLIKRWIRHYIGKYFYKNEQAQEAMFQQLLDSGGGIEAEKSNMQEQKFLTSLLKTIRKDNKNTGAKPITFFPQSNPLYRMGQVLSTKAHDQLLPFFATVDFKKAIIEPFIRNRKALIAAFHTGMLPTEKTFPKAQTAAFLGEDMSKGVHLTRDLPALAKKNELDAAKLRDLFAWAVRYLTDTLMTKYLMAQSDTKDAAIFDYTGKEGKLPPTIESCVSLPISVFDKFPDSTAVLNAKPARKIGEQYGVVLKGGKGFEYRAVPRLYCTMMKAIAKMTAKELPDRPQLKRKACVLNKKMCNCKKPDCSDQLGCEVCEMQKAKDGKTTGEPCMAPPVDRLVDLKPMNDNIKCKWDPDGAFPALYAVPLATGNAFPTLLKEILTLSKAMSTCNVGKVPAKVTKAPRVGKIADGKKCKAGVSGDASCASGYCDPCHFPFCDDKCAKPPGGFGIKDGGDCKRGWQCASGTCSAKTLGSDVCAKTVSKGPNTCMDTLNKLFALPKAQAVPMGKSFDTVLGVMKEAQAAAVCKGFAPAGLDGKGAVGKCSSKEALSMITGAKGETGKAYSFVADYAQKLEKWAKDNDETMGKALDKLEASEKATIDWSANIALGTTFGFGGEGHGGGVGFCTPDTNYIQTLTPVLGYSSSFGPKVKAKEAGEGSLGFSLFGHPIPQIGIGITGTRNAQTGSWNREVEIRTYLTKASVAGGGGDPLNSASLDGGLVQAITPVLSPLLTIAIELFFAADGDYTTAFATLKEKFKEIVSNPKKLMGAFLAAGATALAAAAAESLLRSLSPVAATAYTILTFKATTEDGKTAFSAELQSLKTIEFTIGAAPGPQLKPMVGFGTTMDAGKMLNKAFGPKVTDKGKPVELDTAKICKDPKKAATPECDEPDHRGKLCKMCCELMAGARPGTEKEEAALQTAAGNPKVCKPGLEPTFPPKRGPKTWWCSGSKDAKIYQENAGKGTANGCKPAQLTKDGHEVSVDQCEMVRLDLKTALGANTKSGFFGYISGEDAGSATKGFVKTEKELGLYKQAFKACAPDGGKKVINDPDCFNEAICRFFAVACNPAEL